MSLEQIKELLGKQKLVESMVHSQHLPRQQIIETLVHRQHLTEMEMLIAKLPDQEIGGILEAIDTEDAKLLWKRIPEHRKVDIMWEVSDAIREQVTGITEPGFPESQISAYELAEGRLRRVKINSRKDLAGFHPVWIDLLAATAKERIYIGSHFGLELPDPGDATDLEVSSRFQIEDNDDVYLHSNFLLDKEGSSRNVPVAFILHGGILFSLRNDELPVFRLQRLRGRVRPGSIKDCFDLLLDLYGADVEYSADSLEDIYQTLSKVGKQVLSERMSDLEAGAVLAEIAEEEELNGQIRSNILDTQRALAFLMQNTVLSKRQVNDIRQILRNIESLNSHTTFLFDKINFLMDATIGFININQNRRVTQLTVFGVVFMPINILAGIGGMSEFSMMTQGVPWPLAYGAFVLSMGLIGWGTFAALKYAENRKIQRAVKKINGVRVD